MAAPFLLRRFRFAGLSATALVASTLAVGALAATPLDQLSDLSGRASAIPTLKARDNFSNQFEYDVTVRNLGGDPLEADSLIVIVNGITDLAGKDATDRIEVVGPDGHTSDGKPYFRVPVEGRELPPYSESRPATIRLRNPYYTIVFTPSFGVRGLRHLEPGGQETVQGLLDALIKRGVLSEGEGRALSGRAPTQGR